MKVYKVELMIIDDECVGEEDIKYIIENTRYSNRCIAPQVMAIEGREIGEWHDEHPLNKVSKRQAEYERLFAKPRT